MTAKIDPETELPQLPGDLVSQEIRDEEQDWKSKAEIIRIAIRSGKDVWDWGGDEEK